MKAKTNTTKTFSTMKTMMMMMTTTVTMSTSRYVDVDNGSADDGDEGRCHLR